MDSAYGESSRVRFGRPDPYCWLLVVPMLLIASIVVLGGVPVVGIAIVVMAALVVAFDSWINRPDEWADRRGSRPPRDDWPSDRRPMREPIHSAGNGPPDPRRSAAPGRGARNPAEAPHRDRRGARSGW